MQPLDELTGEEIAAALERWWGGELPREGFRMALAFLADEGGPYPGKTREEVIDGLERRYVANILAEEAEHGLAFARTLAFAYFDQLAKRLAPAAHAETIRSLPPRARHVYRTRYGFDRPHRSVSVRPQHRARAPRRRRVSSGPRKARAPGSSSDDDPHHHLEAIPLSRFRRDVRRWLEAVA
jgi:hypothetical protein